MFTSPSLQGHENSLYVETDADNRSSLLGHL